MKISVGFDIGYDCPQPTPMILTLSIHYSRVSDLLKPDRARDRPFRPHKGLSRRARQLVQPDRRSEGGNALRAHSIVRDPGTPDRVEHEAQQHAVHDLPEETLVSLLGSRYCETDRLSETAWACSAIRPPAGDASRPSAISSTSTSRSATITLVQRKRHGKRSQAQGVCRDFAGLAMAFCRCMNIPRTLAPGISAI